MEHNATAAAAFLRSLASPHRLMILCSLLEGELSVGALSARVPALSQSNLSQHLALLRSEGLVTTRRVGTTIYYAVQAERVAPVLEVLYGLFCGTPAPAGSQEDAA
jgi:DNA-binding transcriptional ArsR family regulator